MRYGIANERLLSVHALLCIWSRCHAYPATERMPLLGIAGAQFLNSAYNKNPITPELRYLTAKMAALLPFRKVADFLGEHLPLPARATAGTVRNRAMKLADIWKSRRRFSPLRRRVGLVKSWSSAWMVGISGIGISGPSETLR